MTRLLKLHLPGQSYAWMFFMPLRCVPQGVSLQKLAALEWRGTITAALDRNLDWISNKVSWPTQRFPGPEVIHYRHCILRTVDSHSFGMQGNFNG